MKTQKLFTLQWAVIIMVVVSGILSTSCLKKWEEDFPKGPVITDPILDTGIYVLNQDFESRRKNLPELNNGVAIDSMTTKATIKVDSVEMNFKKFPVMRMTINGNDEIPYITSPLLSITAPTQLTRVGPTAVEWDEDGEGRALRRVNNYTSTLTVSGKAYNFNLQDQESVAILGYNKLGENDSVAVEKWLASAIADSLSTTVSQSIIEVSPETYDVNGVSCNIITHKITVHLYRLKYEVGPVYSGFYSVDDISFLTQSYIKTGTEIIDTITSWRIIYNEWNIPTGITTYYNGLIKIEVNRLLTGTSVEEFPTQLPFSWVVAEETTREANNSLNFNNTSRDTSSTVVGSNRREHTKRTTHNLTISSGSVGLVNTFRYQTEVLVFNGVSILYNHPTPIQACSQDLVNYHSQDQVTHNGSLCNRYKYDVGNNITFGTFQKLESTRVNLISTNGGGDDPFRPNRYTFNSTSNVSLNNTIRWTNNITFYDDENGTSRDTVVYRNGTWTATAPPALPIDRDNHTFSYSNVSPSDNSTATMNIKKNVYSHNTSGADHPSEFKLEWTKAPAVTFTSYGLTVNEVCASVEGTQSHDGTTHGTAVPAGQFESMPHTIKNKIVLGNLNTQNQTVVTTRIQRCYDEELGYYVSHSRTLTWDRQNGLRIADKYTYNEGWRIAIDGNLLPRKYKKSDYAPGFNPVTVSCNGRNASGTTDDWDVAEYNSELENGGKWTNVTRYANNVVTSSSFNFWPHFPGNNERWQNEPHTVSSNGNIVTVTSTSGAYRVVTTVFNTCQ